MNISPTRNGKWKVENLMEEWHGYPEWNTYTVRDARNCCIATVGDVDRLPAPENLDNARLMACAPRLLEALEKLLDMVTDGRLHGPEVLAAAEALHEVEGDPS